MNQLSGSTIPCPDCGEPVSPLAEACPRCARPKPALSREQLEQAKIATETAQIVAKKKEDSDNFWGCVGLAYLGNVALATIVKGGAGLLGALFLGPLVWLM